MDQQRFAMLTDTDEDVRSEAYEALAEEMDDEIAQSLLEIAESKLPEGIRSDAILALGPVIEECGMDYAEEPGIEWEPELGPPVSRETFASIVERVRRFYDDEAQPKLLRRRALEVLVRDPKPWQKQAIKSHAASDDPDWQLTAVFAMGFVAGFENEIVEQVHKATGPLLWEAIRAAAGQEIGAVAMRIRSIATAEDADLDLRITAIDALPHVDPDCFEILEELSGSSSEEIAEAAEYALEELHLFGEDLELGDE